MVFLQVDDITKASAITVPGALSRSVVSESIDGNTGLSSDSSSGKFVFGTVSGNFQVFCNFSGQSDPSSVASTVASIVSNLKEGGGSYSSKLSACSLCLLFRCF
jgi:hypothetical protein